MEKISVPPSTIIAQCRAWSREAEEIWHRLRSFVEQVGDFLRVRDAGGWIPEALPEDSRVIAKLACWQVQQVMGMGATQICDNTVTIAQACRVFLFADEMDPCALSRESRQVFEQLLEYTHQMETILLMAPIGEARSRQLKQVADSIYRSCSQHPAIDIQNKTDTGWQLDKARIL